MRPRVEICYSPQQHNDYGGDDRSLDDKISISLIERQNSIEISETAGVLDDAGVRPLPPDFGIVGAVQHAN